MRKKILTLFCVTFCYFGLWATELDSISLAELSLAGKLILENGHKQAYDIYEKYANLGNPMAINAAGVMLQRGWGTTVDEEESILYFQKAASLGYYNAYANLAQIYAKGLGVEVDFAKAYCYWDTLASKGNSLGEFKLGYYYYKGLGVDQNYELAVEHFKKAAEFQNLDAYYFLGLCYRNGYGVDCNAGEAQFYLSKAADNGHYFSMQELNEESPETQCVVKPTKNRSVMTTLPNNESVPKIYRKLQRHMSTHNTYGSFEGTITTYDYSGQHIVRQEPLQLTFSESKNGLVQGKWIVGDTIGIPICAYETDSALCFLKTAYARTDRYNQEKAVMWDFSNAVFEKMNIDGEDYLVGNVGMISRSTKEPEKPMYISLKKMAPVQNNSLSVAPVEDTYFLLYPNPVDRQVNVVFDILNSELVQLVLYSMQGTPLLTENFGLLEPGRHGFNIEMSLPIGQYLVVLNKASGKRTSIITKK